MERGPELASRNHHDAYLSRPEVRAEPHCSYPAAACGSDVPRSQVGQMSDAATSGAVALLRQGFFIALSTTPDDSRPKAMAF